MKGCLYRNVYSLNATISNSELSLMRSVNSFCEMLLSKKGLFLTGNRQLPGHVLYSGRRLHNGWRRCVSLEGWWVFFYWLGKSITTLHPNISDFYCAVKHMSTSSHERVASDSVNWIGTRVYFPTLSYSSPPGSRSQPRLSRCRCCHYQLSSGRHRILHNVHGSIPAE